MSTRTTRMRKGLIVALLLPLALLLSACKFANTIEVKADGGMTYTLDVVDTDGIMPSGSMTCDQLMSEFDSELDFGSNLTTNIEDISEDGKLGCRATMSTDDAVDGEVLVDNGDSFTLNVTQDATGSISDDDLEMIGAIDFTFTVVMPGKITEATNGGQIEGNAATYSDIKQFSQGFSVTGLKDGSGSAATTPGSSSKSNTMLIVGIIVIAVVIVIAAAVLIVASKRKKANNTPAYPGTFGQQNPAQQVPNAYGQAGYAQPNYPQPAPQGPGYQTPQQPGYPAPQQPGYQVPQQFDAQQGYGQQSQGYATPEQEGFGQQPGTNPQQ
ncbi:hypothetical protein I6E29_02290 [Arcanobacterium haemolyticum]|nr:hypothetical protein [Arcanobacterium haemolyticum]